MPERSGWIIALTLIAPTLGLMSGRAPAADGDAGPSAEVVLFLNDQIRQGWSDNDVEPSPVADDAEWLRRVCLDIVGHIPSIAEIESFLDDRSPDKRSRMVDALLEHPDRVRNLTEIWTNLLIGRNPPPRTSRSGLRNFLRDNFEQNRPWNEIVYDLISAEGQFEENGAVNFILAQLDGNPNTDEYHVQATAKISRLFLGLQVQCTQCHNHPFNEWKQDQFWELNGFLRQARRLDHRRRDPETGRMADDYSELVYREFSGPVYYETRNGLMQVAYPTYLGVEIDPKSLDRRQELARLMCREDADRQLARALVNRTWGQFFGYGFTRPVDDMGPHNPPSHPEALERLTEEFVHSGYDLKQLCRWICNTQAYGLTSRFNRRNQIDNPAAGEVPLFSRVYVKTMQAEQLYDSLLVATTRPRSGGSGLPEQERDQWLREFLRIFGGNEEDEPTLFRGTIPQALLMMNGPLVQQAISGEHGSWLNEVLTNSRYRSEAQRIEVLYLATLGREPTRTEANQIVRLISNHGSPLWAYQDLCWALLNSNEFIINH